MDAIIPWDMDDRDNETQSKREDAPRRIREPWTRDHRLALAAVLLAAVGIVVGVLTTRGSGSSPTSTDARPPITTSGTTTSATQPIFEPPANVTCAELRALRALQDSPGQFGISPGALLVRVLPRGRYERAVRVAAGDIVRFSMLLHNTSYGAIRDVAVSAPFRRMRGGCWRVVVSVHSNSPSIHSYPAYLVPPAGATSRLVVVPESTILYEGNRRIATLNDSVAASQVDVPYILNGGTAYFVNFDVWIR